MATNRNRRAFVLALALLASGGASAAATDDLRLEVARQWAEKGDYDKAIQELRLFLNEHPDAAEVYARIGTLQLRQGKTRLAEGSFKTALAKDPALAEARQGLAKLKAQSAPAPAAPARAGEPTLPPEVQPARPAARPAPSSSITVTVPEGLEVEPAAAPQGIYALPDFQEALRLHRERKPDAALAALKRTLGKSPGHPGAYYLGGVIRYEKGELAKATYNFKRAFDYPERGYNAHFYLGRIYQKQDRDAEAIGAFRKYLEATKSEPGRKQAEKFLAQLQGNAGATPPGAPAASGPGPGGQAPGAPAPAPGAAHPSGQGAPAAQPGQGHATKPADPAHGKPAQADPTKAAAAPAAGPPGGTAPGAPGHGAEAPAPAGPDAHAHGPHGDKSHGAKDKPHGQAEPKAGADAHGQGEAPAAPAPPSPAVLAQAGFLPFVVADTAGASGRKLAEAYEAFKREQYEKSADLLKEVMRLYGGSPNAEAAGLDLAAVYVRLGLFDDAKDRIVDYLGKAREPQRHRDLAFHLEGLMHLGKGDGEKAERALLKVKPGAHGGPTREELDWRLAQAAGLMKDPKKEAGYLEKAAASATDPVRKADLSRRQGALHARHGRPERALEHYRKALDPCAKAASDSALGELCAEARLRVADMEFRRKRWKEALAGYRRFQELHPGHKDLAWSQYQVANAHKSMRNLEQALNEYKKVIDNYPDSYWASQAKWKREDAIWRKEYEEVLD